MKHDKFEEWVKRTVDTMEKEHEDCNIDEMFAFAGDYAVNCGYTANPRLFVHMFDNEEQEEAFWSWDGQEQWRSEPDLLMELDSMNAIYLKLSYWIVVKRLWKELAMRHK